jgi:hypothetical protein
MTDQTPNELRNTAYGLTVESLWLQRLAYYRSGEWRALGFDSFADWSASHTDRLGVKWESVDQRRERVRELSAEGVSVPDQAALVNESARTVIRDRLVTGGTKPRRKPLVDNRSEVPPVTKPIMDPAPPTPASAAAREALDAERAAMAAKAEQERLAGRWLAVSASIRDTIRTISAALDTDPHGNAARAALATRSPDVATSHLALLAASVDELATHIGTIRTDVLESQPLRRIK